MNKITTYSFPAILVVCLILTLCSFSDLMAQTDPPVEVKTFIINSTKPGVRATALGNSTIADYTELSTVYLNPASLSFVRNMKRVEFHSSQNWNNNLMLQNLTLPFVAVKRHRITLQTGFLHRGLDSVNPPYTEVYLSLIHI